ncbi:hypothetical protein HPB47_024202 [Ixodes persulcatus]|uniref:Uncharacterized protein n=1 Tax=Ixodes persulcatus TaxID=34615 RepID=A0AC60Q7B1_IXOPE|nr:hypothetical protein HPB47_024202 [Ixodes persulcatus]
MEVFDVIFVACARAHRRLMARGTSRARGCKGESDSRVRERCYSDAFEGEKKRPTLPLVVFYASALKNHLEHAPVSAVEAVEIEKIKVRARHFLDTKLKISLLHKTATFLWPQFRQLHMLPEGERLEVYAHVRELLVRVTEAMTQDEHETDDDVRDHASKRRCLGLFQDWCEAEDDKVPIDELEEYLHGKKDYSCSGVSELYTTSGERTRRNSRNCPFYPNASCASLLRVLAANGTIARRATSCKQGGPA